jgi:hypothetical protein
MSNQALDGVGQRAEQDAPERDGLALTASKNFSIRELSRLVHPPLRISKHSTELAKGSKRSFVAFSGELSQFFNGRAGVLLCLKEPFLDAFIDQMSQVDSTTLKRLDPDLQSVSNLRIIEKG